MPANKGNLVIIRIWKSNISQVLTGRVSKEERQVGHISIQTPNKYMSLWPANPPSTRIDELLGTQLGEFILTPVRDVQLESEWDDDGNLIGQPEAPSTIICLYSLNIKDMEDEFERIKTDKTFSGWTLLGNNLLLNRGNAHSCASLAYTILKAGGLYELISSFNSSHGSLSLTAAPSALAEISIKAKQAELINYPDTKKFEDFFKRSTITFNGKQVHYTEKETKVFQEKSSYCNYALVAVGLFAVGTAVIYRGMCPESISDYCESIKSYYLPS